MRGLVSMVFGHRHQLPPWADRLLDVIRWLDLPGRRWPTPGLPAPSPDSGRRVLIAPANFAGQGWQWARALERHLPGVQAENWMYTTGPGFGFPADRILPVAANRAPRRWQRRRFDAVVDAFDAVVIEAGRPLFGRLFRYDSRREAEALAERGVRVAVLWHGTDIRSFRRHAATHPHSPYRCPTARLRAQEAVALRNQRRWSDFAGPVLVSTPDLLADLPGACWCPVTVDVSRRVDEAPPLGRRPAVVVHVPSNPAIKGTEFVDAAMVGLVREGLVEYRRLSRQPADEVRRAYSAADLVLDQFKLGIYGVAACEAMAAGRVVVSMVDRAVREVTARETGLSLPVLESSPEHLGETVKGAVLDPTASRRLAAEGRDFVIAVHDGRMSAQVLSRALGLPGSGAP